MCSSGAGGKHGAVCVCVCVCVCVQGNTRQAEGSRADRERDRAGNTQERQNSPDFERYRVNSPAQHIEQDGPHHKSREVGQGSPQQTEKGNQDKAAGQENSQAVLTKLYDVLTPELLKVYLGSGNLPNTGQLVSMRLKRLGDIGAEDKVVAAISEYLNV